MEWKDSDAHIWQDTEATKWQDTLRINVVEEIRVREGVVEKFSKRDRSLLKAFAEKMVEKMRGLGFLEIDLRYRSETDFEFKVRLKKRQRAP